MKSPAPCSGKVRVRAHCSTARHSPPAARPFPQPTSHLTQPTQLSPPPPSTHPNPTPTPDPGDVSFEDDGGFRYWAGRGAERLSEDPSKMKYSWWVGGGVGGCHWVGGGVFLGEDLVWERQQRRPGLA
jgi:hypothetical protein